VSASNVTRQRAPEHERSHTHPKVGADLSGDSMRVGAAQDLMADGTGRYRR
jgi:hypothetical protein